MRHKNPSKSLSVRPASRAGRHLMATAIAACGIYAACSPTEEAADINIDANAPFIAIPRATNAQTKALRQRALKAAGVVDQIGVGDDFYLAINKRELGTDKKWFLSAYMKQFFPGAVQYGAARSMGTRVVSFRQQNGKLFVFDTANGKKTSDTFNPELLVEAYPVVTYAPFDRMPGSSQFVLFDPAAGMNRFSILQDAFAGGSQPDKFNVELAFSQRYRSLPDGITFEDVFTGYGNLSDPNAGDLGENHAYRSSGTLGMAIRRYSETAGYTESRVYRSPEGQDYFFRGDTRLIPNTGNITQGSIKWGVSSTKPVQWVVSPDIDKLQADPTFAGIDLYGAIAKGVTNWNSVFGYEALKVKKGTADDSYADDDTNYILVDLDPSFGAAFANWRINPNTSEIRGASVYFSSLWAEIGDILFDDDPTAKLALHSVERPKVPALRWDAMPQKKDDSCVLWAPIYKGTGRNDETTERLPPIPGSAKLTRKQKIEQYITHVVLHEVGHTLGLRHNFKGSLKVDAMTNTFTSSVMEYVDDFDAIFADKPGSYDIAAIKLLYGLSTATPTDKFCNDSGVAIDPDCTTFDRTDDPYTKVALDNYKTILLDYLDGKDPTSPNNTLNSMLNYFRAAPTSAKRIAVWNDVMNLTGGSLLVGKTDATKLATIPGYGARVDLMSRRVIQRLYLDSASLRGRFTNDPPTTDSAYNAAILAELTGHIKNTGKFRTVASRRVAADILKKFQTIEAFKALQEGSAALAGELAAGTLTGDELTRAEDLDKYILKLLNPYFN